MNNLFSNILIFKMFAVTGFILSVFSISFAQDKLAAAAQKDSPLIVDLWANGKMPGTGASEAEGEVPNKDGFHRITNISRPTLTVFPAKEKNAPAVIISPGGGYKYVVYDKEGTEVAAWLSAHGFTTLVLKYRTPNNRDGALQDIQRALSLTRANAKQWHVDTKKLGVLGFSAGGNLSAKASNLFDQRAYEPIDAIDKQSCRPDFAVLVYPAYLENNGQIATDLNLKAKIPPTLIVSTEDDKISVGGSKIYHAALDEAKIPNELLIYATGGHGYALCSEKDAKAWAAAALEWFQKISVLKKLSGK